VVAYCLRRTMDWATFWAIFSFRIIWSHCRAAMQQNGGQKYNDLLLQRNCKNDRMLCFKQLLVGKIIQMKSQHWILQNKVRTNGWIHTFKAFVICLGK
jgi:hypothetical protein